MSASSLTIGGIRYADSEARILADRSMLHRELWTRALVHVGFSERQTLHDDADEPWRVAPLASGASQQKNGGRSRQGVGRSQRLCFSRLTTLPLDWLPKSHQRSSDEQGRSKAKPSATSSPGEIRADRPRAEPNRVGEKEPAFHKPAQVRSTPTRTTAARACEQGSVATSRLLGPALSLLQLG